MCDALLMQTLDQIEKLDADFKNIVFPDCVSHLVIDINEWSAKLLHDDKPGHIINLEIPCVSAVRKASVDHFAEPVKVWHCLEDIKLFFEQLKTYAVHEFNHKVSICPNVILAHYLISFENLTELAGSQALD